jgi:hypothetical protein
MAIYLEGYCCHCDTMMMSLVCLASSFSFFNYMSSSIVLSATHVAGVGWPLLYGPNHYIWNVDDGIGNLLTTP